MFLSEHVRNIFDAMREGILIIDTEGLIVFGNLAYRRFLNKEAGGDIGEIVGRSLKQLRPGAQLPTVLVTRKAIMQAPRRETADIYFVNMYPIFDGETLIGGMSVVTFMDDAKAFRDRIEAIEKRSRQVLHRVNEAVSLRYTFDYIVAEGRRSMECKELARRVANSDANVLLTSESGAGKEVYAQAIHNASARRGGVYTSINCATFNPETLDSELFGYDDGAFPGARSGGRMGLFEAVDGGTLFLDEISEMSIKTQSRLLHTLQEHTVRPVGGLTEIPVDVRVIAASNVDLRSYIADGRFRADLYYRLSVFSINVPPLRERIEDLPELARQIAGELSSTLKRTVTIDKEAMSRLSLHNWPGNIRELRSVLEFSAYMSPDGVIRGENLPDTFDAAVVRDTTPLYERSQRFEREEIRKALQYYGSDLAGKKAAAKELDISLASLYSKLKED